MAVATRVNERIERLRTSLEEPLLVTAGVNVRYLTGLASSNAALLVDEEQVLLFTDFRYAEAARGVDGVEVVQSQRFLLNTVGERLSGRIGFEASALNYDGWEKLRDAGLELVPRRGLVERLRAVKDEAELATIREVARITDEAFAALAEEKFVGRTERVLSWRMEQLMRENGAHGVAFAHVGGGPNGALPHVEPNDRVVEPSELVVVDAGALLDGYHSDCTRTFATGDLPDDLAHAYEVCLRGQLAGLETMRAGMTGAQADAASREPIDAAGLGEKYGHGLGHGIGLLVHEAPTARPESTDTLEPGNVITCEPGIYLEGRGGVRIEDLVVITEGDPEVLSSYTKELVTVS
ncbi:MAG: M24 family metallopeptidase [Gaiellaceae bacterium]